jgi:hypothetical protein
MQLIYENLTENLADNPQMLALYKYCAKSENITIVGFGSGLSTLTALATKPKKVTIYDHLLYDISDYKEIADSDGIELVYNNVQCLDGIDHCDLIYIDSFAEGNYVYSACLRNNEAVSRYILINNTVKFAHNPDPSVNLGPQQQGVGVIFGVNGFITNNDPWHIAENFYWDPGLTVLYKRRNLTDDGR